MLSKKLRLSVESFPKDSKTAYKGPYFTVKTTSGSGRVGVIVSKGRAKKAFLRNSIRRFIYNFFKNNPTPQNIDLLVLLNTSIMKLDSQEKYQLESELKAALTKIKKV